MGQQDAFVIEADITIRDRAREPSVQEAPEGYSHERLLDCLRLAHAREVRTGLCCGFVRMAHPIPLEHIDPSTPTDD